jgi:hypothetical protein
MAAVEAKQEWVWDRSACPRTVAGKKAVDRQP